MRKKSGLIVDDPDSPDLDFKNDMSVLGAVQHPTQYQWLAHSENAT